MRMRSFLILAVIFAAIILPSCRPEGVLSQRKMQAVVYDLHRAEGVMQEAGLTSGHDDAMAKYYGQILAKHSVTQAQFDSSLVWYTRNPKRFEHIYPKVIARLQAESDALQAEIKRLKGRPVISAEDAQIYLDTTLRTYLYGKSVPEEAYGWAPDLFLRLHPQPEPEEEFSYINVAPI